MITEYHFKLLNGHEKAQIEAILAGKYALAVVGYLDEKRITRRVGDERVLR